MKEFKGVWYKVANGDLPEFEKWVLIAYRLSNEKFVTSIGRLEEYQFFKDSEILKRWELDNYETILKPDEVIAWTELPKYEE